MTDQHMPLWSDEKIVEEANKGPEPTRYHKVVTVPYAIGLCMEMRRDYEAAVAVANQRADKFEGLYKSALATNERNVADASRMLHGAPDLVLIAAESLLALGEKDKRIAELEETLQFAAQYKGIEGRSCPLCRYENGVYLGPCQMHADMDRMSDTIAELEAQLAAPWEPMEAYCEIYIDGEDGQKYTIGIDGDDNLFVRRRDARDAIVVLPSDEYRLCRQAQAGEVDSAD